MVRIVVYVKDESGPRTYEFLEDSIAAARNHAEKIGRAGFWIDGVEPAQFVLPAQIQLIKILPEK